MIQVRQYGAGQHFRILQSGSMNNQYSDFKQKNYLDSSFTYDHSEHDSHIKQSSKLYSSERLTHADLPSSSTNHKPETSATQLYYNLNSSLDGLFSKIEALKEEHTQEQKNPRSMKKMNMDVSNFPMPNLTVGNIGASKPMSVPVFKKALERKLPQPELHVQPKVAPTFYNQDSKAVSPPTQSPFHRSVSAQNLNASPHLQEPQKQSQPIINVYNNFSSDQIADLPSKQTHVKSLWGGGNAHMKISMEVHDPSAFSKNRKTSELELDRIIEKEANETDIVKKSIVFGEPMTLKDFELGKNVGSGKFGDVHICKHKATGTLYALKKIFKSTILQYNMITQFTRELKIHYRLDHPNIIKLYTHFDDEYHIFLLMEYAEGGILMDKLKCTEDIASRYVEQAIDALQYMHKLKIAHRDIKPENIVMLFGSTIKLCDFGWASYYENQMKTTFCGTLDYLSPEMKEGGQYDNSVDIWSIGVLTYELLTGNPPYRKELMLSMKNGIGPSKPGSRKVNWSVNYPVFMSPLAESFIRNLLKENPEQRATLRFCSTHTFIKKYQESIEDLSYFDEFNSVLSADEKRSPQKLGGTDYLSYNWTPTGSGRPMNAFSQAFDSMQI